MNPLAKMEALKVKIKEREDLKRQLDSTDYKIIKSYEYHLAGLEPPYDTAELHAERETIRQEIRELTQQLKLRRGGKKDDE